MTFRSICFQVVEAEIFKPFFSVVISKLFMASLSVGLHASGVVSSGKLEKPEL